VSEGRREESWMSRPNIFVFDSANVGGIFPEPVDMPEVPDRFTPLRKLADRDDCRFAFAYRRASAAMCAVIEVSEQKGYDQRAVGRDATLLVLVGAQTVVQWWSPSDLVPPMRSGTFFATARVASLLSNVASSPASTAGERMRNEAQACALVCETMDAWRAGDLIERTSDAVLDEAERRRITLARALIDERYAEKLTIHELARACGMGRGRLIRGFKLLYGRTVAGVLAERRLAGAACALQTTNLPVSRIAADNGYCSNAAFTRAFSRRYGRVPSHFRAASP
jgi:AraC-like DNA-binding protein